MVKTARLLQARQSNYKLTAIKSRALINNQTPVQPPMQNPVGTTEEPNKNTFLSFWHSSSHLYLVSTSIVNVCQELQEMQVSLVPLHTTRLEKTVFSFASLCHREPHKARLHPMHQKKRI
jgi:hypothetical protein